jgi:cyclohexanone monooxygenase
MAIETAMESRTEYQRMNDTRTCSPTQTPETIDLAGLQARYLHERNKRIRPEGAGQYVHTTDEDWSDFNHTYTYPPIPQRLAVSEEVDAAVLGGGFAGMLAAVRFKQAGITNLRIIESGGDFGGTWYWNRYPGLQCDVESYVYLPLLEETGYVPTRKYCGGKEIFEHCQRIGRHYKLYDHALFGTEVDALRWDESTKRWLVTTRQGDVVRARFVVVAVGLLTQPKLPGVPGIRDFKGHSFHTARWDYDYTGGTPESPLLTKLADKRVAEIGTGSTGIQVVPRLAEFSRHLYVLQRTPSYVGERGDRKTDPRWVASLAPGWQAERRRNASGTLAGFAPGVEDLTCDGWSEISRNLQATVAKMGNPALTRQQMAELRVIEEFKSMERLRRLVDHTVKDTRTAELLKAWYRHGCKRPCFSDEYLQTFNRPNVTLIDVSDAKGVERITRKGVVANGREYEVDCIVYASGYEFSADPKTRYGLEAMDGRNGVSLYTHWGKGFHTLHGAMTRGFPNLFFTGYTQGAIGNVSLMYEFQADHAAYIASQTLARGARVAEPSDAAQQAWEQLMRENAPQDAGYWEQCTPGHYNAEGEKQFRSPLGDAFAGGFYAFYDILKRWREEGSMQGLILER